MRKHPGNMLYGDEDDYFYCPYCEGEKHSHSLRGLNIHTVKKHPGKNKLSLAGLEDNHFDLNVISILVNA